MTTRRFPLLAIAPLAILLVVPACSTSDTKFTPFQFGIGKSAELVGEDYDVDGVRLNLFSMQNRNIRGLDVGMANSASGSIYGVSTGVLFSSTDENMYGLQVSPFATICNRGLYGLQISGWYADGVHGGNGAGIQLAGVAAIAGEENSPDKEQPAFTGIQAAGLTCDVLHNIRGIQFASLWTNTRCHMEGMQMSIVSNICGGRDYARVDGLQIATVFNAASNLNGLQISLLTNRVDPLYVGTTQGMANGLQITLGMNWADVVNGMQASLIWNDVTKRTGQKAPGKCRGLQIGLVNRVDELHGVQIGLVNLSKNGGLRFCPLINCSFFSPRKHVEEPKAKAPSPSPMPHP